MAKRWLGIIGIGLVAAGLLFVVLWGRGTKEILVDIHWKTVREITLSGEISVLDLVDFDRLEIVADPFPPSSDGAIRSATIIDTSNRDWFEGGFRYDYKFALPMERQAERTYRNVNVFGKVVGKPIIRRKTYNAEYQIIKLLPPTGWKATPSQYKVSKDMTKADFEMGRGDAKAGD